MIAPTLTLALALAITPTLTKNYIVDRLCRDSRFCSFNFFVVLVLQILKHYYFNLSKNKYF